MLPWAASTSTELAASTLKVEAFSRPSALTVKLWALFAVRIPPKEVISVLPSLPRPLATFTATSTAAPKFSVPLTSVYSPTLTVAEVALEAATVVLMLSEVLSVLLLTVL